MATLLFNWNPGNKDAWPTFDEDLDQCANEGFVDISWSSVRKNLTIGDRAFMIRLGRFPSVGIVAAGAVSGKPYPDSHWSKEGRTATYVPLRLDVIVDKVLERAELQRLIPTVHWSPQGGGMLIPEDESIELENIWAEHLQKLGCSPIALPDEIQSAERFIEGAVRRITVNAYERNPKARAECIKHHGCSCKVCGFNFEKVYGQLGANYIHVHHLKPLSQIRKGYIINPISDLRPVCPNCHAMIHSDALNPLSLEQLKAEMRRS